jgi:hypothetical protein
MSSRKANTVFHVKPRRFRKYQLKLKPQKCVLFTKTVEFLGRKVSADGLEIGNQHLKPVQDWVRDFSKIFDKTAMVVGKP